MASLEDYLGSGSVEFPPESDAATCPQCVAASTELACARCGCRIAAKHFLHEIEVVYQDTTRWGREPSAGWLRTAIMGDRSRLNPPPGVDVPNDTRDTCLHCLRLGVQQRARRAREARQAIRATPNRFLAAMEAAGNPGAEAVYATQHRRLRAARQIVVGRGWTVQTWTERGWYRDSATESTLHRVLLTDGTWRLRDDASYERGGTPPPDHEWDDVAERLEEIARNHGVALAVR